jgi:uncharacterized protein (TIGR00255 family)
MTLSSMTGFARAQGALPPWSWVWEAKSVNGRSLEMRLRLPPGHDSLEAGLRALAQKHLKRGNLQLSLTLTSELAGADLKLNREALRTVVAALSEVRKAGEFAAPDAAAILSIRGVLEASEEPAAEAEIAARDAALLKSAETVLEGLKAARLREGAQLHTILAEMLERIARLADEATAQAAALPLKVRDRIKEQVSLLLESRAGLSEERLAQELALIAAKADVREEIDRLRLHVRSGVDMLTSGEAVGRRLDFLSQELNREANTVCSKANDVGLTRTGLELKVVIDQLREQVQNVE